MGKCENSNTQQAKLYLDRITSLKYSKVMHFHLAFKSLNMSSMHATAAGPGFIRLKS